MATCGKMGRSRRNICALVLLFFLQLSARGCLSAPANLTATTQDGGAVTAQNPTTVNDTASETQSTPPEQKANPVTSPKDPASPAGNSSIPTQTEPPKDDTAATNETAPKHTTSALDISIIGSSADNKSQTAVSSVDNKTNANPGLQDTDNLMSL
ncbi:hypothetical protein INR49_005957 [Caranx melampygus]|nr:hypothetical protein INR49_005957 [Caranx melampygus]